MISKHVMNNRGSAIGEMIPHIVQTACSYKSVITFEVGDKHVNAKSIMGVMALASQKIDEMTINVDGADEETAMAAILGVLE